MSNSKIQNDELVEATLELLECRKLRSRFVSCLCCREDMFPNKKAINICTECLDEESDTFYNTAISE